MSNNLQTPVMDFCGLDTSCYTYMFYNWQTLIAGFIAILAAVYAGRYVRKQIEANNLIEEGRLLRREKAARAVLPLTLTKFIDFADDCAEILRDLKGSASLGATAISTPQLPQHAITDLERTIEAASDQQTVTIMVQLAGHTQVLHSIIAGVVSNANARGCARYKRDPNMVAYEIRTARVYAAASRLFAWARGEDATTEDVTWKHIEEALAILNLGDEKTIDFVARNKSKRTHPLSW